MPSHNLDIDARDLSEAPRLARETHSRGTVIGASIAVVLFLALLIYGSLPELSPHEIVAMEGYAGEQPTKHIFNIHSLEGADDQNTGESSAPGIAVNEIAVNVETPAAVADASEGSSPAPVQNKSDVLAVTEQLPVAENPREAAAAETVVSQEVLQPEPEATVAEVANQSTSVNDQASAQAVANAPADTNPASDGDAVAEAGEQVTDTVVTPVAERASSNSRVFNTGEQKKVVAAMATTPTIDESTDTVVVASIAAVEPVPMPVGVPAQSSKGKLLPLRSVLADYTELKASPSSQSKTLLSLGRGVVVTAFERRGKWIHIGTNDGSSITGYVLESSLGRVSTGTSG